MTVNSEQSVTGWFHALRNGDNSAAAGLWDRYFERVVRLAGRRLVHDPAYDEEDLAASVFGALFNAAQQGRYPDLADRDELWALLLVLAQRKMIDRVRRAGAKGRMGPRANRPQGEGTPVAEVPSSDPAPELSAAVKDECEYLLNLLNDSTLQAIALRKLDGRTIPEISDELGLSQRTVSRRLLLIRKHWERELN